MLSQDGNCLEKRETLSVGIDRHEKVREGHDLPNEGSCQGDTGGLYSVTTLGCHSAHTREAGVKRFFRHYHFPVRDKSDSPDESGLNDSAWAIIAGLSKAYTLPFDYVLDMSFANVIMYSAVLPSRSASTEGKEGEGKKKDQEIIEANDPDNKEKVKQFFESCD